MNDPIDALRRKAVTDAKFRAELLKDPAAVIERETGRKLPKGMSVKIVEDGASVVHLVLPAAPGRGELSDSQLETLAGGVMTTFVCGGATWTSYRVC